MELGLTQFGDYSPCIGLYSCQLLPLKLFHTELCVDFGFLFLSFGGNQSLKVYFGHTQTTNDGS